MLKGRRILIGVCGSIAAYKIALLVRLCIKSGADVRVVMTPSATKFIGELTFRTLTGHPVYSDLWKDEDVASLKSPHVHLAEWAEIFCVAPCTADTLARMSEGRVQNALDAVYLSARCPVVLAPAMDLEMYRHPAVQHHISTLQERGVKVLDTEPGELASGLSGEGRLKEPEELFEILKDLMGVSSFWQQKKVLVSAGPTYERIDPVRFIGNFASGKMGFALAESLRNLGAEVTLVSGPTALPAPAGIKLISVESAAQMGEAIFSIAENQAYIFMAAAVADYTPAETAQDKIKKSEDTFHISLKRTQDILAELGRRKKHPQKLIGFALETRDEENYARQKLSTKNLDMIVLNSLRTPGAGFGTDTNLIHMFCAGGQEFKTGLMSKTDIAASIIQISETL